MSCLIFKSLSHFEFIFVYGVSVCVCVCVCACALSRSVVSDSCNPIDHRLPGSSVYAILQARILEWIAIPFSRGSSPPRNQTKVSCIAGKLFTDWAMREALWCERVFYFYTTCWKDCLFSTVNPCLFCWRLTDYRCAGLFLSSWFCSTDLSVLVCFCANPCCCITVAL